MSKTSGCKLSLQVAVHPGASATGKTLIIIIIIIIAFFFHVSSLFNSPAPVSCIEGRMDGNCYRKRLPTRLQMRMELEFGL
jgi:hypothetical protein